MSIANFLCMETVVKLMIVGLLTAGLTVMAFGQEGAATEKELPQELADAPFAPSTPELELERVGREPVVLAGKVGSVTIAYETGSEPVVYLVDIVLKDVETLRGMNPLGGKPSRLVIREKGSIPVEGKQVLVVMNSKRGMMAINGIMEVEEKQLEKVRENLKMPLGWEKGRDGWVSPWAGLHDSKWPERLAVAKGEPVCVRTGRPGAGMPKEVSMWVHSGRTTEEGKEIAEEGTFTITLTNGGKESVTLPMLLQSEGRILWSKLAVAYVNDEMYLPTDAEIIPADAVPVVLKARETVKGVFEVKSLKNLVLPNRPGKVNMVLGFADRVKEVSYYFKLEKNAGGVKKRVNRL